MLAHAALQLYKLQAAELVKPDPVRPSSISAAAKSARFCPISTPCACIGSSRSSFRSRSSVANFQLENKFLVNAATKRIAISQRLGRPHPIAVARRAYNLPSGLRATAERPP